MTPQGFPPLALLLLALCPHGLPNALAGGLEPQGIYLNLSADAVLIEPRFRKPGKDIGKEEEIDACSREEVIAALNAYIDSYVGTQVRGLFFNVNYQRACFDSEVMESYWELPDPESEITGWPRLHWAVKKKDVDPFAVCVERCRADRISPWISIRMNDHHYFDLPERINRLWLDHPELRTRPPHGLFNYGKQEVRDYYKALIREVLEKYDVDGLELDWMRTHHLFPDGEAAGGMKLIDQFMREIRALANEKSQERGHPIRIAVRVPPAPEIGRHFGLDAAAWAREGLIDLLIPSNWFTPTNFDLPIETWKQEIGSGTSCLVAAGADATFCIARNKFVKQMQATAETMRGFAVSAFDRGADAIYIYNNFLSPYRVKAFAPDGTVSHAYSKEETLHDIGRLSTCLGKPRTHVLTYTDPEIQQTAPREAPPLPTGAPQEFKIHIGPKPQEGRCVVRTALDSRPGVEQTLLSVSINGATCRQIEEPPRDPRYVYDNTKVWDIVWHVSETGARVLQFEADLKDLVAGSNRLSITINAKEAQALTWLELHLE